MATGGEPAEKRMKLDLINRWLTLAANIGVLAGILVLVLEVRQNTVAIQSAAASSLQAAYSEAELLIAGDQDFAEVLVKGRDADGLSPTEQLRLLGFYRTVLRGWQNTHYQYLSEVLDPGLWEGELGLFRETIVADSGLRTYWSSNKSLYSPAFNRLLESLTSQSPN